MTTVEIAKSKKIDGWYILWHLFFSTAHGHLWPLIKKTLPSLGADISIVVCTWNTSTSLL